MATIRKLLCHLRGHRWRAYWLGPAERTRSGVFYERFMAWHCRRCGLRERTRRIAFARDAGALHAFGDSPYTENAGTQQLLRRR